MGKIRALSEQLLSGEATTDDLHPFFALVDLEEVAPNVAFVSGLANVAVVRGDAGLVLIDAGSWLLAPQVHRLVRGWSTEKISRAVFTHGHVDHVTGLGPFDEEAAKEGRRLEVLAHRAVPARFERYLKTRGYNEIINSTQFGLLVEWPREFRQPDRLYDDELTLDLGGATLELHHARGETDDHTWAFVPEAKALFTGDLFIWASPNAGNPQKVQRYPDDWARALRRMALCEAEVLCPGHGVPIFGKKAVRLALDETAELLESLCEQTLSLLNEGRTLDEILASVKAPPRLLARPYLKPIYDEPEFVVHNIVRLYGGWYDGNPAHLKPARHEALSRELCSLSGGLSRVIARARELSDGGDHALASHLAEIARGASPDDPQVIALCRDVYLRRASAERSVMAKGIFRTAAEPRGK